MDRISSICQGPSEPAAKVDSLGLIVVIELNLGEKELRNKTISLASGLWHYEPSAICFGLVKGS